MTFDPSVLAILAFTVLLAALLTEASLTYRDWWRRWRTRPLPTPRPRLVRRLRRPFRERDDQAPYGTDTSLIG
jgi:hypothetical protein